MLVPETVFQVKSGVVLLVTAEAAGAVSVGATGIGGFTVTERVALHAPQFPAASFAFTCQ